VADYDRNKTLYIDPAVVPTIVYSTYFGGHAQQTGPVNLEQFGPVVNNAPIPKVAESGLDVALDGATPPHAYITGSAYSTDLPTASFFQPNQDGTANQNPNVFIAKFDTSMSDGSSLIYATYLGAKGNTTALGTGDGDLGFGIAVDGNEDAYVVGQTYSGNSHSSGPDFPGVSIATGGVAGCGAWGTAGKNNGGAASTNVGFVSELLAGGDSLEYSCYIPGSENATAARVALVPGCASDCDAYIVGSTQSTAASDGFVEVNGLQTELATGEGGLSNAFMMVVGGDGAGSTPVYSTFYGGTANGKAGDAGLGIAVASATEVAITGLTFSGAAGGVSRIPLSAHPAQSTFLGGGNKTSMAFVAMINPTVSGSGSLTYGTYLGGSGSNNSLAGVAIGDIGTGIVIDGSNLWIAGTTASTDFPVNGVAGVNTTNPPIFNTNQPEANVGPPATTGIITELTPSSTAGLGQVTYSTYFGGGGLCLANFWGAYSGLETQSAPWPNTTASSMSPVLPHRPLGEAHSIPAAMRAKPRIPVPASRLQSKVSGPQMFPSPRSYPRSTRRRQQ